MAVSGSGAGCPLLADTVSVAVGHLLSAELFQILFVSVSTKIGPSWPKPRQAGRAWSLGIGLYDRFVQCVWAVVLSFVVLLSWLA